MNRRKFLYGSSAAFLLGQAACNLPKPTPTPPTSYKTASVNIPQLAQVITQQQCPEWCWAACISMIFDFYGHPLSQAEIVVATYGNVTCLPAGSSTTIGRDLSRPYIDDNGIPFSSQVTAAYDFFNGINSFDNLMIVDRLNTNNPLLYCNTQHAMVVYAVDYIPTGGEPNIVAVHVVDPWPFSPATHPLTAPEMVPENLGGEMTFCASVQVT